MCRTASTVDASFKKTATEGLLVRPVGFYTETARFAAGQMGANNHKKKSDDGSSSGINLVDRKMRLWRRLSPVPGAVTAARARGLVDRLINALGDRPRRFLDRMFDRLELKIYSDRKKVKRLEEECERLKNDDLHIPNFRPPKTDSAKEQVYTALAGGPKTKKELARTLGMTVSAISNVGLRLRAEGRITSIWRDGKFMWVRRSSDSTLFIAARGAILETLKNGPMTASALARETGKGIPTIKSALHRHLLGSQTVIRTKFGVYGLAGTQSPYVSRGDELLPR